MAAGLNISIGMCKKLGARGGGKEASVRCERNYSCRLPLPLSFVNQIEKGSNIDIASLFRSCQSGKGPAQIENSFPLRKRLPCLFFVYLYLTWAGSMDKVFCTYFLFFFWKKAAVECRSAPGLAGLHQPGTNTLFLGQELAPDGHLLSVPLRCCNRKALLPYEEKRAVPLPPSVGFLLLLSVEHRPPLWWKQGWR